MHHILGRQIKRYLGEHTTIPPEWRDFFESVSRTYADFDEDRALFNRSFEISSKEFLEKTRLIEETRLKVEEQAKNLAFEVVKRTKELNNRVLELEDAQKAMANLLQDLGEERRALAEAKAKDEALLESIGEGVVATDQDGKVILMNKAAEGLLRFTSREILGKFFIHAILIQDAEGNQVPEKLQPITLALSSGKSSSSSSSYYFIRKDGTKFPVAEIVTPFIIDSKIVGAIIVFHDITREKELDRAKTEFISIASHQLRTPVSGLSWLTEALEFNSQNLNPKQKIYVKELSVLSNRLIMLVEDLLNISRIQLKTEAMTSKEKIDISSFIKQLINETIPYANLKKHEIVFINNITQPLSLNINKRSLYNIFQNLASNAIDYSPANTAVTINLEKTDQFIKVSISNKGPAISKEEQSHMFERFYRAESTKKIKPEGTGLGLYIGKVIVEEMGGQIGFETEKDNDTMFWFTIPLDKTDKKT